MCILYTPAGDTDPIRNFYDGPILHIIRTYHPTLVKIFLSKDMTKKEDDRHVYSKAIKYIAPTCKIEFIRTDITKVFSMDKLLPLADGFSKLRNEYPSEKILLNISSGTPQMKTIMSFLAMDFDNVLAVQVLTPNDASNRNNPATQDNDDIDFLIENNFDNESDYKCRCIEPALNMLHRYGVRYQLISLVSNYEYSAALSLYKKNNSMFNEETGKLLRHADLRSKLQYNEAMAISGKKILKDKWLTNLNEFFMVMQLRQKKGELAEFIMKLTPFLYELLLYYYEHRSSISPKEFCYPRKGSFDPWQISRKKLQDKAPAALAQLDDLYNGGFRDGTDLSFFNMLNIIPFFCNKLSKEALQRLGDLREIESRHRNSIAHTIVNITEDLLITTSPKLNSHKIVEYLYAVMKELLGKENVYSYNIYEDLNKRIIKSMDQFKL